MITMETGQCRCFKCGVNGGGESKGLNHYSFIRRLWEQSFDKTKLQDYEELAHLRGIRFPETLMKFNLAKSSINGDWLIPGYSHDQKLTQLFRYVNLKGKDGTWKHKPLQTPQLGSALFGMAVWNDPANLFVCEGPFDPIVLYESLEQEGMLTDHGVIGLPGTQNFRDDWAILGSGINVKIAFDNDHPDKNGRVSTKEGIGTIASAMNALEIPPSNIEYLSWGEEGYDPAIEDGFDTSDLLRNA